MGHHRIQDYHDYNDEYDDDDYDDVDDDDGDDDVFSAPGSAKSRLTVEEEEEDEYKPQVFSIVITITIIIIITTIITIIIIIYTIIIITKSNPQTRAVDSSYSDPLGPAPERPKTSVGGRGDNHHHMLIYR